MSRQHVQRNLLAALLLAVLSRCINAQNPSTQVSSGECASCTPLNRNASCDRGLPICVNTSSGGSSNLPCAELIPGAETLASSNMSASIQQQVFNSMPQWMQPTAAGISAGTGAPLGRQASAAPTAAQIAAAQCPADKPNKMCCGVKALTGTTSSGPSQSQTENQPVSAQPQASQSEAPRPGGNGTNSAQAVATNTSSPAKAAAGAASSSVGCIAQAAAVAMLLLRML